MTLLSRIGPWFRIRVPRIDAESPPIPEERGPSVSQSTGLSRLDRIRARIGPLWPYVLLIAAPTGTFVLPDLFGGHLLITGDNLQQNYPLHVLVGSMLRHGQLPLWNPYIFSGTPLLAGFNAGALHPVVGLFAILPDRVAWIATESILFSFIGVGMYAYLRALKLSARASFLSSLIFMAAGTVFSQVNHLDMTAGFAALPWMLLAVLRIVRDGRWRWSIVLGVAFATVILGGAPEAMLDEAILVIAYAAVTAGFDRVSWWRVATRAGAGAALAVALAAVQWLPGLSAIHNSDRTGLVNGFAGFGNFLPPFGLYSLVPNLFGGYGHLGEAQYFSRYNLPEVGIYLGILPIIALLTLWHRRWPSALARRDRLTWYIVGTFGVVLALGPVTPLEHIFNAIPLYGHQRLQSRNMIDYSVAACVLFAGWLDCRETAAGALRRFDRCMAVVPAAVVGALAVVALAAPNWVLTTFGYVTSPTDAQVHTVREATLIALAFCLGALAIVWLRPKLSGRTWFGLVSVFMVVDVGLIAWMGQLSTFNTNDNLGGHTAIEQYIASHLVPNGRYILYDPVGVGLNNEAAGFWDLNILAGLPSVGGYAAIVNGNYQSLTNTHSPGELNIHQLDIGTLDGLDLQALITVPEYLLYPVQGKLTALANVQQVPEHSGIDPVLPYGNSADYRDYAYSFYPDARPVLGPGQTSTWFFGESLQPRSATLLFTEKAAKAVVRFGLLTGDGVPTWGPAVLVLAGATGVSGQLPKAAGSGMAVQVLFGSVPPSFGFIRVGPTAYELDGSLSNVLRPGRWTQEPSVNGYTLFVKHEPPKAIYALTARGRPGPQVTVRTNLTKVESVRVVAPRQVTIVRDVAWDPGWKGTVSVNGGPPQKVAVTAHGLVQQIIAPAGDDVVTFTYMPPHFLAASVLSLGAVGFLVLVLVVTLVRRRRARSGAVEDAMPAAAVGGD